MISDSFGIVDAKGFSEVLQKARNGQEIPMVTLMRTLGIEAWLRGLQSFRMFVGAGENSGEPLRLLAPITSSAEKN